MTLNETYKPGFKSQCPHNYYTTMPPIPQAISMGLCATVTETAEPSTGPDESTQAWPVALHGQFSITKFLPFVSLVLVTLT